jgi:hypothetical protein
LNLTFGSDEYNISFLLSILNKSDVISRKLLLLSFTDTDIVSNLFLGLHILSSIVLSRLDIYFYKSVREASVLNIIENLSPDLIIVLSENNS